MKPRCGKCEKDILNIEPAQCSCCEKYFHVQQECCDANRSSIQQLFSTHKALWLCVDCRKLFANRTLHAFLDDTIRRPPNEVIELRKKVEELSDLVNALQRQIGENHEAIMAKFDRPPNVTWPQLSGETPSNPDKRSRAIRSRKRRCGPNGEPVEVDLVPRSSTSNGTSDIDLSDLLLTCPIAAALPPPRFWIYLSGFNPKITDDDVVKITKRCLNTTNDIEAFRLVPRNVDDSRYSFVSYKIGVDIELKDKALLLSSWPQSVKVREFVSLPKNDFRNSGRHVPNKPWNPLSIETPDQRNGLTDIDN
ncbi:uncharacterized protein LOC129753402 [Uranotaenia lowii]|uniref:uncharacterized protein LOC129753402 n=1 Tax=Uranotaenia lowii TaxID=190385 RepID=UPI00247A3914|nr:uncharacterized protein LOC129753402 [Uranotaenia lowii]